MSEHKQAKTTVYPARGEPETDAPSLGPMASEAQVKAAARMLVGLIEGAEVHSGVLDDIQQSAAFSVIKSWSKRR